MERLSGRTATLPLQIAEHRLTNPVVLGGDIHSFWANELKLDFDDPAAPVIASEFVGTSVTSNGPPYEKFRAWIADNPEVRFFDSRRRGYVSAELRPERLEVRVPRRQRRARSADRRFDIAALCRRERTAGTTTRVNEALYSVVADLARRDPR